MYTCVYVYIHTYTYAFFKKKSTHHQSPTCFLYWAIYTAYYIYVHIYNIYFNNYIQVMTHRIYSFPRWQREGKFTNSSQRKYCEPSQQELDTPSEKEGQQQKSPVTHYSSWAVRMQTRADGPTLPGRLKQVWELSYPGHAQIWDSQRRSRGRLSGP